MKRYFTGLLLILTLTGCGSKVLEKFNPNQAEPTITIQKSVDNVVEYKTESGKNLAEAMTIATIPYQIQERGQQEVISEMLGVITTMSKSWNLYINDEPRSFAKLSDVIIQKGDTITWKYQSISE